MLLALLHPEVYEKIAQGTRRTYASNKPRAVLFEGPPGTGKTTSARFASPTSQCLSSVKDHLNCTCKLHVATYHLTHSPSDRHLELPLALGNHRVNPTKMLPGNQVLHSCKGHAHTYSCMVSTCCRSCIRTKFWSFATAIFAHNQHYLCMLLQQHQIVTGLCLQSDCQPSISPAGVCTPGGCGLQVVWGKRAQPL